MDYINVELKKIRKSSLLAISIISLLAFSIIYFIINSLISPDISCFKFIYRSYAILAYFPILVPPILFTSLLLGKEFQDRTLMYTFIRPIKYNRLFVAKIAATYLYSLFICCLIFILTVIYGVIFFDITPFEFDSNIFQSCLRCFILLIYTSVGTLLVISLSSIVNMYLRNMVGSVINTMIMWVILSIIIFKFNINNTLLKIPINTYLSPAQYYNFPLNEFFTRCIYVTLANIILIIIELFILYRKSLKFRNVNSNC